MAKSTHPVFLVCIWAYIVHLQHRRRNEWHTKIEMIVAQCEWNASKPFMHAAFKCDRWCFIIQTRITGFLFHYQIWFSYKALAHLWFSIRNVARLNGIIKSARDRSLAMRWLFISWQHCWQETQCDVTQHLCLWALSSNHRKIKIKFA